LGILEVVEAQGPVGGWEADREQFAVHVVASPEPEPTRTQEEGRRMPLDDAVEYAPYWSSLRTHRAKTSFEFDLISQRDAEIAHCRDRGLQSPPCVLERSGAKSGDHEAAPLVEAERLEVIVRRYNPNPLAIRDFTTQCAHERAPDALPPLNCSDECEFAGAGLASVHEQPDGAVVSLGHKARQRKHVDQLATPRLEGTAELSVQ
jgi:hypothetical protein